MVVHSASSAASNQPSNKRGGFTQGPKSQPSNKRGGFTQGPKSQRDYLQGTPKGQCRDFYLTRSCQNFTSGKCRYKHQRTQDGGISGNSTKSSALLPRDNKETSISTLSNIASGLNSDALSSSSSLLQVDHAILFKVANDVNFKFTTTKDVYLWVNSLYASTQVKRFLSTHETAQNVLSDLAKNVDGPGMARLAEVLNFPFSVDAGMSKDILSFQRGFLPLVYYLTSGEIRNSVLTHHVNRLYHSLHVHASTWVASTISCIESLMKAKTVKDSRLPGLWRDFAPSDFVQIFSPLTQLLQEYLSRFTDVIVRTPRVQGLVDMIATSFETYANAVVIVGETSFDIVPSEDPQHRRFVIDGLRRSIETLRKTIERTQAVPFIAAVPTPLSSSAPSAAALATLQRLFQPPGELRTQGARHDNDHASIKDIAILPTHLELLSRDPAFVPSNLPEGPHHLPNPSMHRQIDIIFRLLREDFVGPLRAAVSSLFQDLGSLQDPRNALGSLLKRGGGRYRPTSSIHADTTDLSIYPGVEFAGITLSKSHELQLNLDLSFPKSYGRSHLTRHLAYGNLVGLICRRIGSKGGKGPIDPKDAKIFLGLVTEEAVTSKIGRRRVGISFFDGELYLEAIRQFSARQKAPGHQAQTHGEMVCFEVPGFLLGTLQPFLKALQRIEPAALPFAKYLAAAPPTVDSPIKIDPPLFARTPGFAFDLSSALATKAPPGSLVLNVQDPESVRLAVEVLQESSSLDPSQAEAMVDCLSREVALVRGPPGTGKSFLGVALIRVLLAANVGRILILSYTNHALDTMLRHIHDDVTKKIVRAGSRSQDPTMEPYLLNNLAFEQSRVEGRVQHETRSLLGERKDVERLIKRVCDLAARMSSRQINLEHLASYLHSEFPQHLDSLRNIPTDIVVAVDQLLGGGEWDVAGKKGRHSRGNVELPKDPSSIFAFWRDGGDLYYLERAQAERDALAVALSEQKEELAETFSNRFDLLSLDNSSSDTLDLFEDAPIQQHPDGGSTSEEDSEEEERYVAPTSDRSFDQLENDHDVWSFSRAERERICEGWADDLVQKEGPRLDMLRRRLEEVNAQLKSLNNDAKLRVLKEAQVVGATTNSASNLLDLISAVEPTILVVEEAGECLEAQVIANLVPSIQQLIMIGDEKQLRPQISSYHLSIDSTQGQTHRHDVSLFERLAVLPIPISMLRTQRRMRPEISSLIRNFLYPDLEDAPQVHDYPDVKGMSKNVFFIDHRLPEDSQAMDHSSKQNSREAVWVVDSVRHLLKNGYKAGQIAVLTPYLGQLSSLKRELEKETISVAVDERDQADLATAQEKSGKDIEEDNEKEEEEEVVSFAPVEATMQTLKSQIDLRTIDRFQGEEADIVILSLVRNSASSAGDDEASFINLDRAAKSSIGFLKSFNRTNVAVSRAKHGMFLFGDAELLASKSKMWDSIIEQLEETDSVSPRIPARCENHPELEFVVDRPGKLPEVSPEGGCFARCDSKLSCGHSCTLLCHPGDPEHRKTKCISLCPVLLECSHPCSGVCSEPHPKCTFNIPQVTLECGHQRKNLPCSVAFGGAKINCTEKVLKPLPCGHEERLACSKDPTQVFCNQVCGASLECSHSSCQARCGQCRSLQASFSDPSKHVSHPHGQNLACGHFCKPCNTLPSDTLCTKLLKCGHVCPSLESEDCSRQICPRCASPDRQEDTVDFIMFTKLGEFDEKDEDPSSRLITVNCGHSLSVGTLDGLFEIEQFYTQDLNGHWTGLAHPKTTDKTPPRCPTCKASISCVKRYGRSLKHREATVQERLWTIRGQSLIATATDQVDSLPKSPILHKAKTFVRGSLGKILTPAKEAKENQRRYLSLVRSPFVHPAILWNSQLTGLPSTLQNFYTKLVGPILQGLHRLFDASQRQSPQSKAYEAAITKLFNEEKQRLERSPPEVRDIDRASLQFAHSAAGMAPPTTDIKLQIQHIWLSVGLRYTLADVVTALADVVWSHNPQGSANHQALVNLAVFVFKTALHDCQSAIELTESRRSGRLGVEGHLHLLQTQLEYSRFLCRAQLDYKIASRSSIVKSMEDSRGSALAVFDLAVETFSSSQPLSRGWLDEEVLPNRDKVCESWEALLKYLRGDTIYQPVTDEERKMVIASQGFATSSHWYVCENGHPYAIGECSGAAGTGRCYECGSTIGGSGHRVAGGGHDAEMIRLAEETGARADFPWGPLGWDKPGFSLNRPLYDGHETGWHVKDPKDDCNYLGYGFTGNDKQGYDFKNRGFSQLLNVDIDFYATFEFKHFVLFEYSKSREINYTTSSVDVDADEKARLAEQSRSNLDSPHLDANSKASDQLLAQDGKDVNANRQIDNVRDKLKLTAKRYDELKFKLKANVEIEAIQNEKKKLGQKVRYYGNVDVSH
ncbi:hypothetical protein JCM5353_007381 [Sporobolomyces roseus]